MKSSVSARTRPTLLDGLVVVLVLCGAALLLWLFRPADGNFLTASIVLDGVAVAEYDLSAITDGVTFDVDRKSVV